MGVLSHLDLATTLVRQQRRVRGWLLVLDDYRRKPVYTVPMRNLSVCL
jgi:hypothetical protein